MIAVHTWRVETKALCEVANAILAKARFSIGSSERISWWGKASQPA